MIFSVIRSSKRSAEGISRGLLRQWTPESLKSGDGAQGNVSAPSYFITNAHTRFILEKRLTATNSEIVSGRPPGCTVLKIPVLKCADRFNACWTRL